MIKPRRISAAQLRNWGAAFLVIAAVLALPAMWRRDLAAGRDQLPSEAVVQYIHDGDTIALENGEKVRYLGIDAPEVGHRGNPSDCFGRKAKNANFKMVLGKKISLRYSSETRDRYGRLLAWVFLPDGTNVNLEMVKFGNAWIYNSHHNINREMFEELLRAQREAIHDRRGLWGACSAEPEPTYIANTNTYIFHRPGCPLGRETSPRHMVMFSDRLCAFSEGYSPCRECKP